MPAPDPIEIRGIKEKDLGACIDSFVGNWQLKEQNKQLIRNKWKEFLHLETHDGGNHIINTHYEDWSIAYIPRVAKRMVLSEVPSVEAERTNDKTNPPYFFVLLNTARDPRPPRNFPPGVDFLQDLLNRGAVISRIDGGTDGSNFYLSPNLYPGNPNDSLLISEEKRPQDGVKQEDIVTWQKFSYLTGLTVLFNSIGAGNRVPERLHALVFDKANLNYEGKLFEFPIKNDKCVKKESIRAGVYRLKNYPASAFIFNDKYAAGRVDRLVKGIEQTDDISYNIIVDGIEVYVVPRNRKRELSNALGRRVTAVDIVGVITASNVERYVPGQAEDRVVYAEEMFTNLDYKTIEASIEAACIPEDSLADLVK